MKENKVYARLYSSNETKKMFSKTNQPNSSQSMRKIEDIFEKSRHVNVLVTFLILNISTIHDNARFETKKVIVKMRYILVFKTIKIKSYSPVKNYKKNLSRSMRENIR